MANPRIMIAAPKSGSGKTLITCALLGAMVKRGLRVRAFKCGPDYIDPMFHKKVIGIPSRNLDLFFTGEEEARALFLQDDPEAVSVIEGVMGLYDGLAGIRQEASSYHLAAALHAPVILVINARGMGRSLLAEIHGFLSMDEQGLIKGVILNQVSEGLFQKLAPLVREECGIDCLGYFKTTERLKLESRYLGLKLPDEVKELKEKVSQAADLLETTVDVDKLLQIAENADTCGSLKGKETACRKLHEEEAGHGAGRENVRIGIARDEAFCFYYEDNLRMLREAGAELIEFSPLHDVTLPENLQGLLLGGGYPELMAKELSENVGMREQIRKAISEGMPSLAECGGFMYLHDGIQVTGANPLFYPMAGLIHGVCQDAGRLVRFGYATFQLPEEFCLSEGLHVREIRGHEFHRYDSTACGEDLLAVKPVTNESWKCGYCGRGHLWSYGHFYYPSNPEFPVWFVEKCRNWKGAM